MQRMKTAGGIETSTKGASPHHYSTITVHHNCTIILASFRMVDCVIGLLIHGDDVTRASLVILLVWIVTWRLLTVIAGAMPALLSAHAHSRDWSILRRILMVHSMDRRWPDMVPWGRTVKVAIVWSGVVVAIMALRLCRCQHLLLLLLQLTLLLLEMLVSPLTIELFGRLVAWQGTRIGRKGRDPEPLVLQRFLGSETPSWVQDEHLV